MCEPWNALSTTRPFALELKEASPILSQNDGTSIRGTVVRNQPLYEFLYATQPAP